MLAGLQGEINLLTNNTEEFIHPRSTEPPAYDIELKFIYLGFTHFRMNAGYPDDYDSWNIARQLNYEKGRHRAAIIKYCLDTIPEWDMYETFSHYILEVNPELAPILIQETHHTNPMWSGEISKGIGKSNISEEK